MASPHFEHRNSNVINIENHLESSPQQAAAPPNTPENSTLSPNSNSSTIILSGFSSSSQDNTAERQAKNERALKEILEDSNDDISSLSDFQQSDIDEFIEPIRLYTAVPSSPKPKSGPSSPMPSKKSSPICLLLL